MTKPAVQCLPLLTPGNWHTSIEVTRLQRQRHKEQSQEARRTTNQNLGSRVPKTFSF